MKSPKLAAYWATTIRPKLERFAPASVTASGAMPAVLLLVRCAVALVMVWAGRAVGADRIAPNVFGGLSEVPARVLGSMTGVLLFLLIFLAVDSAAYHAGRLREGREWETARAIRRQQAGSTRNAVRPLREPALAGAAARGNRQPGPQRSRPAGMPQDVDPVLVKITELVTDAGPAGMSRQQIGDRLAAEGINVTEEALYDLLSKVTNGLRYLTWPAGGRLYNPGELVVTAELQDRVLGVVHAYTDETVWLGIDQAGIAAKLREQGLVLAEPLLARVLRILTEHDGKLQVTEGLYSPRRRA